MWAVGVVSKLDSNLALSVNVPTIKGCFLQPEGVGSGLIRATPRTYPFSRPSSMPIPSESANLNVTNCH